MDLYIPQLLKGTIADFGGAGISWLESLPCKIRQAEQDWSLCVGAPVESSGYCSWVAPAILADGSQAILKIQIPHPEARYEAEALRLYDGRGVARLINVSADGFTLLLERCVP